ncbi:hypothetical protein GR247_38300 [Rhizobium leguminosarum]|uniref:Uncharacterized protein n=1 Tax=Rhizobium leguminosarum TaxID=384 RepID=A0A6P0C335_RHILE|nr:hypothetical protein [Rhizobium leguminosarum]MBY5325467.1 hypothetical protein [Rhizobium leguminosarum]NEI96166.1 hypothetical protein [Rhizobium leguminosarum]NEJ25875.1 hypothetical protein [Rhizobium leguminosarum]NEJ82050.1 hypothetical protein [Rhizobium leguminosarum]NEK54751.1 hypothetical protein [Rhizobium leguminosarum]
MPSTMNGGGKTPPSTQAIFEDALAKLPDGYVDGYFDGRPWGVTVKRSEDRKRTWLYGEELSGTDIVSFNLYRLAGPRSILKPCEMSSAKVIEFVRGFEPSPAKAAFRP